MKNQQVQLASKHNVIRVVALIAMLALMVCCTVVMINAAAAEKVTFKAASGITYDSVNGLWTKTYDGEQAIALENVEIEIANKTVVVTGAQFNSKDVETATAIEITYTVDGEPASALSLPARITPAVLSWDAAKAPTVTANSTNVSGQTANVQVEVDPTALITTNVVAGEAITFVAPTVTVDVSGAAQTFVDVNVTLQAGNATTQVANYKADPLKVKVVVEPAEIVRIDWVAAADSFVYGDSALLEIRANGYVAGDNTNAIPMTVVVKVADNEYKTLAAAYAANQYGQVKKNEQATAYTLVAQAPNALYQLADNVEGATKSVSVTKKIYNVVLNGAEVLDGGDLTNPSVGTGYFLAVEGKDGMFIPEWALSKITYKYTDANGVEVAKVTKPGVYTVTATMPSLADGEFENAAFDSATLTATLTVIRNYLIVTTPDGSASVVLVGANGISAGVSATLTIPEALDRAATRGFRVHKEFTLSITGAAAGETFRVLVPVSTDLVGKNCADLTAADLYIVNGSREAANAKYTVSMSEDGSYYIIEGYAPAGEITLMIAPQYQAPFWVSAPGIAIIILIALILLVVIPLIVGLKLIQLEKSGRNPVITVETKGNVPEVEPVVIPDKIEDPDAVLEEAIDDLAEELTAETEAEAAEEADVDASEAVAEAMNQISEEIEAIDLAAYEAADIAAAEAMASGLADELVKELMDQVDAEDNSADVSEEVKSAVAEAMAENFNESADATDAVALITDEEVVEEEAEEVAEEPVVEEPVVEETVEETVEEVVEEAVEEVVEEPVVEEPVVEEPVVEDVVEETPAAEAEDAEEEEEEESFGGFGSMPLNYIDAIAQAELYNEMLEQERRGEVQLVTRYRRSYLSRLAQSQGSIQDYYNAIKNLLLSYKGVKNRISWGFESFNVGRTPLAKFNAKTRTLYVYIALTAEELAETKYNVTDMSAKKKYAAVPSLIKVKGDRKFKHALELITKLCEEKLQLPKKKNFTEEDYRMPFKTTEELVQEGIVKMMVAAIPVAAPAEEAAEEVAPVEEVAVEEVTVEEVAVEEAVAEEAVAEEAVAEEAVAEEAVAEEDNQNA